MITQHQFPLDATATANKGIIAAAIIALLFLGAYLTVQAVKKKRQRVSAAAK